MSLVQAVIIDNFVLVGADSRYIKQNNATGFTTI